jgi:hypothetical protein
MPALKGRPKFIWPLRGQLRNADLRLRGLGRVALQFSSKIFEKAKPVRIVYNFAPIFSINRIAYVSIAIWGAAGLCLPLTACGSFLLP